MGRVDESTLNLLYNTSAPSVRQQAFSSLMRVLGPVLFLLFINDVTDIFSPGVTAGLFADDLKLYVEIVTDVDHFLLQNNLIKLEEWSRLRQLNISVKNVIF